MELDAYISSCIYWAHEHLDSAGATLVAQSTDLLNDGIIAIDQSYTSATLQLDQLKQLAGDISSCTSGREDKLNALPIDYKEKLNTCIVDQNVYVASLVDKGKYVIDISINDVKTLEFQVKLCGDSIICLEPIFTKIALMDVELPQKITLEENNVKAEIEQVAVMVSNCHTLNVSNFVGSANVILGEITDCVNDLLSK